MRSYTPAIAMLSLLVLTGIPLFPADLNRNSSTLHGPDDPHGQYRGVSTAVQFDVSPELRDIVPLEVDPDTALEITELPTGLEGPLGPQSSDSLVQSIEGPSLVPAPSITFDGPSNIAGASPPDPVGDVGPNHYVAMSNLYFAIYSKAGVSLYGPAANNTLWAGFGGACQNENAGQPIVLYDQLADRWLLSQTTLAGPTYYNCVAISTSGNPLGSYYRYAFSTGTNFPDSPKYGVWPDAYYISTREFTGGFSFAGVGAYAINRSQVLNGNPTPSVISFLVTPAGAGGAYNIGDGLLPADLDGTTLPPANSPAFYVGSMDDGGPYSAPQDALTLWKFSVDFTTPANSSFLMANTISVAAFDSIFPCSPGSRNCIPQPGTTNKVDIQSYRQRLTWRLAYRNFGTHESLVANQSVEAVAGIAGIRWYEIRSPRNSPVIYQQGTYAPGSVDGIHRWMGSAAMDGDGNLALGYSASDATTTYPSIWYTGRLAGDPLGTLAQGEAAIKNGTGSQTASNRWGNFTSMNIDPVDDCTFWYVNEYIPVTSSVGWRLHIGAFKFPGCSVPPPPPTFCNNTALSIPTSGTSGQASIYPSNIVVSGLGAKIMDVNVSLLGLTHTYPDDIDALLVGPQGQNLILMSDAGGSTDIVGANVLFDDSAATAMPDAGLIGDSQYRPTNYGDGDTFPPPAPAPSAATTLATFTNTNPNGTWSLYIVDDLGGDSGSLSGWCLEVTTPTLYLPLLLRNH